MKLIVRNRKKNPSTIHSRQDRFYLLELLQKQHEFYVTPHPIEIPYYLCVRTSQLGNDRSPHSSRITDDVYGKKELDTEYWFSVPKEK